MANHRWNGKLGYGVDSSSVACRVCGCIKQYVKGKPTYFINDTVYLVAPDCQPIAEKSDNLSNSMKIFWNS